MFQFGHWQVLQSLLLQMFAPRPFRCPSPALRVLQTRILVEAFRELLIIGHTANIVRAVDRCACLLKDDAIGALVGIHLRGEGEEGETEDEKTAEMGHVASDGPKRMPMMCARSTSKQSRKSQGLIARIERKEAFSLVFVTR